MCTVVLLTRPGHAWPLLLAANRDERLDREWDSPADHWGGSPDLIAGRDRLGGGTWMAVRHGLVATVLNRQGSLGPQAGKRSRGGLPLLAACEPSADRAAAALAALDSGEYRTFNMVVADRTVAWFIRGMGAGHPEATRLQPGLHMVTAHDPDDLRSPRVARHLPRFRAADPPDPAAGDWRTWQALIADSTQPRSAAINVPAENGFGTICSSLLAVPKAGRPVWRFAAGPPDHTPFLPVTLL